MVTVRLLGVVGAESDGQVLPLGTPRQRGLLAWLAMAHPRPSSMGAIMTALWHGDPPASARNAVQVYSSGLRKVLAPHGVDLVRSGDGYALHGDDLVVDTAVFTETMSRGRAALRAGDTDRACTLLEQALDLWAEPLEGLGDLAFADTARAAIVDGHALALGDLATGYLRSARAGDAAVVARRLLDGRPFDEHAWGLLATALYADGRQDESLEALRQAKRLLRDELGLDASPELAHLEARVLSHDPGLLGEPGPEDSEQPPEPLLRPLPLPPDPFVGREALVSAVVERASRPGHVVTLSGIGGIGKTSLALAVGHALAGRGQRVAFVALDQETEAGPALERICRSLDLDPGSDPVERLVADLAGLTDTLILDNVEQIDGFSEALGAVRPPDGPGLVVTSRSPLRVPGEDLVTVPPLRLTASASESSPAVTLFLSSAHRAGGPSGPDEVRDAERLCGLLDGIPLAIELAASRSRVLTPAQLADRIERTPGFTLTQTAASSRGRQASLGVILRSTYDSLDPTSRETLRLLAEIDGGVPLDVVEPAVGDDVVAVLDALEELVAAGLVTNDHGSLRVLMPVREFCRALDGRDEYLERFLERALAFALDGPSEIAGPAAQPEVERLLGAEDALVSALRRAAETGRSRTATALVMRLHRVWLLSGRLVEARRWIETTLALAKPGSADRARLALLAGTFASYINDPSAVTMLDDALHQAAELSLPPDRVVVNGWCCLAATAVAHGLDTRATQAATRAAELAATSGSDALVALARDLWAHVASMTGDHAAAVGPSLEGLEEARGSGDIYDLVIMLSNAADNLAHLGRVAEARLLVDEAFDRAKEITLGPLVGNVLLTRGLVQSLGGDLAVARSDLREGLRIALERYPDQLSMADALFLLGHCAAVSRFPEEAVRCFAAADALYEAHGVSAERRLPASITSGRELVARELDAGLAERIASRARNEPERVAAEMARE